MLRMQRELNIPSHEIEDVGCLGEGGMKGVEKFSWKKTLFHWSLPNVYSSCKNDNGVLLFHIRKTNQIENLDRVIFRNRLDAMFPLAMCKIVPVIFLSSKILKVRSFVDDVRSCEGSSWTSFKNWCCLREEHCRTRIHVWNSINFKMILQEPSFIDETLNPLYWRMLPCE